ncbi:MAG TPA: hypothetical protein V6C95_00470 [Coleofasciculaceae cyanobacterium]
MKISNASFHFFQQYLPNWQVKFTFISAVKSGLEHLIDFLKLSNEPRIWKTTDRQGNTVWRVYDPVSDRAVSLESEDEIRSWLEKRYYN